MTNPVPGYGVTTPYGRRGPYWSCDRDAAGNGIHTGVDIPAPVGTRVVAARPGRAVYVNFGSAFGFHQLVVVNGDTRDFYAHMPSRAVGDGMQVDAGQTVGKVGAEGNVTGPHLHFERHAVPSGGWSCSIVRDPAPSLSYAPSSGSGSGSGKPPKDPDMATYVHGKATKATKLRDGDWLRISWDASNNDDWFDGPGILVGGRQFSAALSLRVTGRGGATVESSWTENESGDPVETYPTSVLGAYDNTRDSVIGLCQKGRRLSARVRVRGGDAMLERADVNLLVLG